MDSVQTEVEGKRYVLLDNDIADVVERFSLGFLRDILPMRLIVDEECECGC